MVARIQSSQAVPGPVGLPIIGRQLNKVQLLLDPITYMIETQHRYHTFAACTYNDPRLVLAFGADANRQVLANTQVFNNLPSLPISFPVENSPISRMTSGLIFMNGERHRQHRRLIMPAFHKKRIETYHETLVNITETFLDGWQTGQQFDVAVEMQHLALEITSRVLFGLDTVYDTRRLGSKIHELAVNLYSIPVLLLPPWLSRTYRKSLAMAHELEQTGLEILARKRAELDQAEDVFAALLQMRDEETGETLSNAELIGHMTVLFVAGHESSRNTLLWALLLLAQHPEVLQRVHQELSHVLNGAAPTYQQLDQLPLLEAVIKETMRLLPTTPYITRKLTEDYNFDGYALPQDGIIVISPYVTHHDPAIYAEPQRFKPERWLKPGFAPSIYEYLPFGAGGRMCVAATFGMMELKIILAILLQRHWLKVVPGARIDRQVGVTMGSKYGLPVTVQAVGDLPTPSMVRGQIHQMVSLPAAVSG